MAYSTELLSSTFLKHIEFVESIVVQKKTGIEKLVRSLVPKTDLARPATEASAASSSWREDLVGGSVEGDKEISW